VNGTVLHIFKGTMVKVDMTEGTWEALPAPNFQKIAYGDIPLLGKYIPKITNYGDFRALSQKS